MKRMKKILAMLLCFVLVMKPITIFGAEVTLLESELTGNQEGSEENSTVLEQTVEPLETQQPEDSIVLEETQIPVIGEEVIETKKPDELENSVSYISKTVPTESELIVNDYILYFANCGATIIDAVSSEDKIGLYQSVTDKEYGEDKGTGYHWGYRPNDTNSVKVSGGTKTSTKKEDTYWYVGEMEYVSGTSGFYYDFEVPNGTYEVIVGFKNPWSGRPVDVVLEDTTVSEQVQLNENALVESKNRMEVTDGELNVFVHNPTRTDQYKDPILNYIIVKAIPAMDTTALEAKITLIKQQVKEAQDSGVIYATERLSELYLDAANKEDTITDLNAALSEGTVLVESGTASEEEIEGMINKIETIYSNLRTIEQYNSFSGTNGALWKDTNGVPIQAHGGQVQKVGHKWWWYGEDKTKGYRSNGISAYSSDDLYNWKFEGYVMRTMTTREQLDTDSYFSELYKDYTTEQKDNVFLCINNSTAVIERPKMIYNEKTKKYVLWFHADGPTLEAPNSNYAAAAAGVAISNSPTGPFQFIDRYRLHVCPEDQKKGEWYEASAGFARDMNLFIDDDNTAYIIYSSEENRTMFISRLNEEYTYLDVDVENAVHGEDFVRLFPGAQREAPAIFKFNEKYYMITSGATGWAPNQAQYWVADDILGEWKNMGDPCVGDTNGKTFYTQSTNVITLEEGSYIYMGDRWNDGKLEDSRYVWLPVEIDGAGNLFLKEYKDWILEELEGKNTVKLKTKLEDVYYNINDLPKEVQLQVRNSQGVWEDKIANVTWKTTDLLTGAKTAVTGSIDSIQTEITAYVVQLPDNLLYFIDSGAKSGSVIHQEAVKKVSGLINKDVFDKAYTEGSWGYTGSTTDDIGFKNESSTDAYESGLWARGEKTIDYSIPLEAGNYKLTAGFQEWWGATRNMMITISYKTKEGKVISKELGRFTNKSQMAVAYPFTISEDAEVTICISKQASGNPDPVLSWIAVEAVTKDALQQAKDKALQAFDEFVADVVARKDEFETEIWLKLDACIIEQKETINRVQTIEEIEKALQQAKDIFIELQVELGILKNEPILQYDFEENLEGNIVKDTSGNENNATLYGTAAYVEEAERGQVLYLDGEKGTYAELPVGMFDGMNQMTIVMDVKSQSTGNFFTFGIGKDSTNYMFLKTVGTTVKNSITKGSYSAEQVVSGSIDKEGEWSKVVIVVEEDKMVLYLNGKKVDEKTGITTKISDFGTGVLSYLGKSFYSADAYFKGYFDNIAIYNKALNATELSDILGTEILTELPTTLKKGEILELPEVVEVLSRGEIVKDNVIWEAIPTEKLSVLGNQVTIKGTLEKTKREIETTITVISKKLVYYVDSGNQNSETFEILKKNSRMLKNKVADQAYDKTWGYVGIEGTEFGIRDTESTDPYETGLFSKSGNDIVYKMQLEEGTYRITAGFMEWWNQPRHMDITMEYINEEDKTIETIIAENVGWNQVSGNVPESEKRKTIEEEFTIPIDTEITIRVKKHASSQDPVLSFLGLELLQSTTIRTGTIVNGEPWYDTEGDLIQAHGGDFLYENGMYYWFGENKSHNSAVLKGVSAYSSKDLVNWTYENDIITTQSDPELESCKIERPKVVYNEFTKKYVMWGHWEEASNYNYGHVVVATCDTITGDYEYLGHFDPGNQSRDFTIFVDDDKKAYLFTSANSNADMDVYLLNESYTNVKEKLYTIYAGQRREAPAVVKKDGYYYMLTSGQSGWQPNQGYYAYTTDITKKDAWSELYKFGNTSTFYSQPANILTVNGTKGTTYIYIGDRWNQNKLGDSRYIWLPFEMNQGTITMEYQRVWQINAETGLVQTPKSMLISQNKKATASNEAAGYSASNAIDGNFDTYFDTGVDSLPYWWSVDLGKEYDVSDIDISWRSWKGSEVYYKYTIEGSKDGQTYETIVDASSNTTTSFTSHELTGSYRYIRIHVMGQVNINNGNSATWYRGIHEVRVFGSKKEAETESLKLVANPFKLAQKKDVTGVQLVWNTLSDATMYEVYRADHENGEYSIVHTGSNHIYEEYDAIVGKTYYYKVKALNNGIYLTESQKVEVTPYAMPEGLLEYNNQIGSTMTTITSLKSGEIYYRYDFISDENGFKQIDSYTSSDGLEWTFDKIVMDRTSHEDLISCKLESMNIQYDANYDKMVLWAHWEEKNNYNSGKALVASAVPGEKFKVHNVYCPEGIQVRDMNFFLDDDANKTGYLIAAANKDGEGANATIYIFKMNETYTDITEVVATLFENQYREAPCMIKSDGYYYLFTSQAAGWYPSKGAYASSTSIETGWTELKSIGNNSTFSSQSGGIIKINGEKGTTYTMMANRWIKEEGTAGQICLPLTLINGMAYYDYAEKVYYNPWNGTVISEQKGKLLSQGKTATASLTSDNASKANDGDYDTAYIGTGDTKWPFWWQVDLGDEYELSNIQVSWFMYKGSEAYYKYKILGSVDGENWNVLLDKTDNKTYGFTSDQLEGKARYVRLEVEDAILHNNPNNWYTPTLYEVKVFGAEEKIVEPTTEPTKTPTETPTVEPTKTPTETPTVEPTKTPTETPTINPTQIPIPPVEIPTTSPVQNTEQDVKPMPAVEVTKEPVVDDSIVTAITNVEIEAEDNQTNIVVSLDENAIIKQAQEKEHTLQVKIILPSKQLQAELEKERVEKINVELSISKNLKENKKLNITNIMLENTVLKKAKEVKKDIIVKISDKEDNLYGQWSFNKEVLQKTSKKFTDVNLLTNITESRSEKIISDVLEKDKNNEKAVLLQLGQAGIFPAQAELKVYVGNVDGKNKKIYLYYYNTSSKKLDELKDSAEYKIDDKGYICINVLKGGKYIILPKQPDHSVCTTLENQIKTTIEANIIKVGDKTKKVKTALPVSLKNVKNLMTELEASSIGNVNITYTSSNKSIATIGKTTGKIIANKRGKVTFTTKIKLYDGRTKTIKNMVTITK